MNIWWRRVKTALFWIAVGLAGVFATLFAFVFISFVLWALF
jgi:hypothetical protein